MRALLVKRVLLAALLACGAALAQEPREPMFNLVTLSAQAEREIPNDLLVAVLAAEAEGPDPAALANTVNRAMRQALDAAKAARGVQARSGNYQTYPVYEKGRVARWRVRQELRLESADFEMATELIGRLQASLVVTSLGLAVSGEARRQAENALTAEAIAVFEERARIVRDALKAASYRVRNLSVSGSAPQPRPFAALAVRAAPAEGTPPAIEPGTTRMTVNVSGTVQLQP